MFSLRLILKKFNRISQNLINEIDITFTADIQTILGSNGSGKSSIVEMLSPLPPNSEDFHQGGYKEYHCLRNGCIYISKSDMDKGIHYLERDGVVLNNWGTASTQRAIVHQEFGLTDAIFKVLIGSSRFTDMSPTERRDWCMFISKMDINPLMNIFNQAKDKARDSKGYLSKITDRFNLEKRNKVDEDKINKLKLDIEALRAEFEYYNQFSQETKETTTMDLDGMASYLKNFMDKILANTPKIPDTILKLGVKDVASLDKFIHGLKIKLENLDEERTKLHDKLSNINKIAEATAMLSNRGIKEIEDKISELQTRADYLKGALTSLWDYEMPEDAKLARMDFARVGTELRTLVFELPANDSFLFNSAELEKCNELIAGLTVRLRSLEQSIFTREHTIRHIVEAETVTCPKCTFSFKRGYNEEDIPKLEKEILNYKEQLASVEDELAKAEQFRIECKDFIEQVRQIYRVMNLTPSNNCLWAKIKAYELYRNPSLPVVSMLEGHSKFLDLCCDYDDVMELLTHEKDVLVKATESLNLVNSDSDKEATAIDSEIYDNKTKIEKYQGLLKIAEASLITVQNYESDINKLNSMFDKFNSGYFTELDNNRAIFIKDTKYNIMKEINAIELELEQAKVKNSIIDDIESELAMAKKDYEEHKLIVDNLSPNTGLIADLLNESIDVFVNNINNPIKATWTSDLVVKPCLNKKGQLDWKFPVMVKGGEIRKDVSKTSLGERDIINLAFQLIVANHIGGEYFPLVVDEFGVHMDEQHRLNVMHVLADLVETKQCSQMFMISHYAAFHEQFSNSEILVIDSSNIITMPRTYNQHVKIC